MLLEDIDLVPLYCVQVVIQRQQNQEGPKHGNGGQEVPDIVVIKEVEEDAVAVVLPGLCGGFLAGERASSLLSLLCRDQLHTCLQPTPWHPLVPNRRASRSGSCLTLALHS